MHSWNTDWVTLFTDHYYNTDQFFGHLQYAKQRSRGSLTILWIIDVYLGRRLEVGWGANDVHSVNYCCY